MTKLVAFFENDMFSIAINESESIVGRGEACDMKIPHPEVSRRHCRVWIEFGSVWIEDLGSRNGTFLNGMKIDSKKSIKHGDSIALGSVLIKCLEHEESNDNTTESFGNICSTEMIKRFFRKY